MTSEKHGIELMSLVGKNEERLLLKIVSQGVETSFEGTVAEVLPFLHSAIDGRQVEKLEISDVFGQVWSTLVEATRSIRLLELVILSADLSDVDPAAFHQFVLSFRELSKLNIKQWRARQTHLTNDFLRSCAAKGIDSLEFPNELPINADFFDVTDKGIVDYIYKSEPTEARILSIARAALSPQFTRLVIKENKECRHTKDVVVNIRPIHLATQEGLADYADHQDDWGATKLYSFKWTVSTLPMFCQLYFHDDDRHDLQIYRAKDSVVTTCDPSH